MDERSVRQSVFFCLLCFSCLYLSHLSQKGGITTHLPLQKKKKKKKKKKKEGGGGGGRGGGGGGEAEEERGEGGGGDAEGEERGEGGGGEEEEEGGRGGRVGVGVGGYVDDNHQWLKGQSVNHFLYNYVMSVHFLESNLRTQSIHKCITRQTYTNMKHRFSRKKKGEKKKEKEGGGGGDTCRGLK